MNGKRDGTQKALLAGLLAAICLLSASAATKAEVSFTPGAWSTNDWILVKSPRFNYMHGFVQREDGIWWAKLPVMREDFLDGKIEFTCETLTGPNLMIDRVVLIGDGVDSAKLL